MKVNKLESIVTPKTTGYVSAAGLGVTVLSGICSNKTVKKAHKPLAWATAGLTLLHIGLIEYYHYKYKHKQ